ncbi:MAG: hypothetical protein HQM16_02580 [Deltaproteobacteria bacterium]|nr:hypothetical protein [Deltaproteobacteria bacterium]
MIVVPGNAVYNKFWPSSKKAIRSPHKRWFSYGRHAFVSYFKYLEHQFQKINTVWVPDYICHEVVNSFNAYNYEVKYYPLNDELEPDLNTIASITKEAVPHDVFLLCHFYGKIVKNLKEISSLLTSKQIHLIEDCVHLPFANLEISRPAHSAARMFSFRKIYPVPYGSFLVTKDEQKKFTNFLSQHIEAHVDHQTARVIRWMAREYLKSLALRFKIPVKRKYTNLSLDPLQPFNFAHPLVERMIDQNDWHVCFSQRRENYVLYQQYFKPQTDWIKPFEFDIQNDCPYQFPLTLASGMERKHFVSYFLKHGVAAQFGLALHKNVLDRLPKDHHYNRHVTLPVHQGISEKEVMYVCDLLKQYEETFISNY